MRVAIFASGNGTNFEALAGDRELYSAGLEIALLICDQPKAKVIERAREKIFLSLSIN